MIFIMCLPGCVISSINLLKVWRDNHQITKKINTIYTKNCKIHIVEKELRVGWEGSTRKAVTLKRFRKGSAKQIWEVHPSKGDRLNVPSGWTPVRRNSIYGLRVAKSPSSLMNFCSPFYLSPNDCCFACVSFHISVFPFPSALKFNSPYFPFCPALSLLKSCWACLLQVPSPMYFLPFTFPSRTSLYCGFYLDLWILPLLCL